MKNKKILLVTSLLLSALLFFAGCGKTTDTATPTDGNAKSTDTDATAAVMTSDTSYLDAYNPIIDRLYELAAAPELKDMPDFEGIQGIFEVTRNNTAEENLKNIGYTVTDINNDGRFELLTGYIENPDAEKTEGNIIYALYSYIDGEAKCLFEGATRSCYRYTGEDTFVLTGSAGAMYSIFASYHMSDNGDSMVCDDYYFTSEKNGDYSDIGFFHNTTGEFDVANSDELTVSEDEFWKIEDELTEKIVNISLTPLAMFKDAPVTTDTAENTAGAENTSATADNTENTAETEGKATVTVSFADEDTDLSDCETYTFDNSEYEVTLIISTDREITDFSFNALTFVEADDEGNLKFDEENKFTCDKITPDRPFAVTLTFNGDIPAHGISYTDTDGNTVSCSISLSGMDGSPVLSEY